MYSKIVVPVDLGQIEKGEKILAKALALLDEGGSIELINVTEDVPGYLAIDLPGDLIETAVKQAETQLADLKARNPGPISTRVRVGPAAREILAHAEEVGADLILIASHRPDFSNYLLGSTADRVVRHAKCSVLVER